MFCKSAWGPSQEKTGVPTTGDIREGRGSSGPACPPCLRLLTGSPGFLAGLSEPWPRPPGCHQGEAALGYHWPNTEAKQTLEAVQALLHTAGNNYGAIAAGVSQLQEGSPQA